MESNGDFPDVVAEARITGHRAVGWPKSTIVRKMRQKLDVIEGSITNLPWQERRDELSTKWQVNQNIKKFGMRISE